LARGPGRKVNKGWFVRGSKYRKVFAETVVATARQGCFLGRAVDEETLAFLTFLLVVWGSGRCKHLRVPGKTWLTEGGNGAMASA
jgi:hypothetical protein